MPAADVKAVVDGGLLSGTTDFTRLADVDTVNICVPTPLRKTKDPDLSYIVAAVEQVATHLRVGQLVVLESTTYPGTVDEVVQPRLEEGGLRVGTDIFLAFSPERVDPGNTTWTTRNIAKVVGGVDARSTELAAALYGLIVDSVVQVSSPRVAEMVKLLENTFRAVNIGLVNELALMCRDLDVNVWEVIDAVLLFVLVTVSRASFRLMSEAAASRSKRSRRVLIYGAGSGGQMLAREMRANNDWQMNPVGFLDDDPIKQRRWILGLPVPASWSSACGCTTSMS